MSLSDDDILRILKIIDESSFDELHLETEGTKLVLRKSGAPGHTSALPSGKLQPVSAEPVKLAAAEKQAPPAASAQQKPLIGAPITTPTEDGCVPVTAPMLGIFYRSPRPGAPPFVEMNALVSKTDTVCLIEVMKLFSAVMAGTRGRVAKVCVENGQMVEFGQTLFLIRPEGDHHGDSQA